MQLLPGQRVRSNRSRRVPTAAGVRAPAAVFCQTRRPAQKLFVFQIFRPAQQALHPALQFLLGQLGHGQGLPVFLRLGQHGELGGQAHLLRSGADVAQTDPEEFLGYNPFTASIEIKLHSDYANSDSIARIEKMIKKNTNIQDVLYRKELIDAVNDNIRNISLVLLALAVVLTFISFALINNTIRLAIYSKRFLIHTMKLVGASWGFIRGPFLRKNVWSGILAAIVADSVLMGTAYWAVTYEQELLQVITPEVMLIVCASVLVFGIVITWLCAYFSMNKYLRMKANSLYYI